MAMPTIWQAGVKLPSYGRLRKNLHTDTLIIGGGMAGLLCAHRLRELGVDCVLLEAETVCGGVTAGTTAKLTAQHGLLYHTLPPAFGWEGAKTYLQANLAALERFKALCGGLDCDFEEADNYVYTLDDPAAPKEEAQVLRRLGVEAQFTRQLPLPFPVAGAVRFPKQGQFHPLKLAAGLLPGLNIYEHSPVRALSPHRAVTDNGSIVTARHIIVCTHFPFLNRHGSYFMKLYQHRTHMVALKGAPRLKGMYVDDAQVGLSFRSQGPYLILGGGDHKTGQAGGGWAALEAFARRHWPEAQVVFRWAAQDCMSLDGVPYIGQYSRHTPGLYVATGFNKWGMTSSMAAALLLGDLVTGRENPWAGLFSPSRSMLRPQLLSNMGSAVKSLLTPTVPRCPHMGCALKWDPEEGAWTCPCHGSRFDREGRLLEGPATRGMGRQH